MKLQNKVAIVTGGARDIGAAVSKRFAAEGAKVVINYYNNQAVADETLQEITAAGGTATLVRADMTRQAGVDEVLSQARRSGMFAFINKDLRYSRPEVGVSIDRELAARLGISMQAIVYRAKEIGIIS